MFIGLAIFASVFLWLMVKERGFRRVVFIGTGVVAVLGAVIGVGVAIWYYGFHAPAEARQAKQEETTRNQTIGQYTFGPPGNGPEDTAAVAKKSGFLVLPPPKPASEPNKAPDGFVKTDTVLYDGNDLSGRAVGTAEINDMVKIVARDNIWSTLRVKDMHSGLQGWVPEDSVQLVTVGSAIAAKTALPPCPKNDPLGIRDGATPCKPPSPTKGAPPCPANDPAGLSTTAPCAPLPQ